MRRLTFVGVIFIYICEVITSEGVCCLCRRGISFVGVFLTSVSVVCGCVVTSVGVAITSEGVIITLWRGFTFVCVVLPL